jgi:hypothetical protein
LHNLISYELPVVKVPNSACLRGTDESTKRETGAAAQLANISAAKALSQVESANVFTTDFKLCRRLPTLSELLWDRDPC